MIFSTWKKAKAKAMAHGLHMWFSEHWEKGVRLPIELYKNPLIWCLNYEDILSEIVTHGRCVQYKRFGFDGAPRECLTSHLQVGELLLLMGNGLLHQHTLNALFHGILLCLEEE